MSLDLDNHLTRSAFPAEAVEEDILVNDDAPTPFPTLDLIETPEDMAIGLLPREESPEQLEIANPQAEALESQQLQESRSVWRQLPMSTRVAEKVAHYDWAFFSVFYATDSTNVWWRPKGHQGLEARSLPSM